MNQRLFQNWLKKKEENGHKQNSRIARNSRNQKYNTTMAKANKYFQKVRLAMMEPKKVLCLQCLQWKHKPNQTTEGKHQCILDLCRKCQRVLAPLTYPNSVYRVPRFNVCFVLGDKKIMIPSMTNNPFKLFSQIFSKVLEFML